MEESNKASTNISRRLNAFLAILPLNIPGYAAVSGIGKAALGRISRGSVSFSYLHLITIGNTFNLTALQFQDESYPIPGRKTLIRSLRKYIAENNREVILDNLLLNNSAAHFLNLYIEQGYLNTPKTITQIRLEVLDLFEAELSGPQLSNLLNNRYRSGSVKRIIDNPALRTKYLYQLIDA